jgi:hypothetical protein
VSGVSVGVVGAAFSNVLELTVSGSRFSVEGVLLREPQELKSGTQARQTAKMKDKNARSFTIQD